MLSHSASRCIYADTLRPWHPCRHTGRPTIQPARKYRYSAYIRRIALVKQVGSNCGDLCLYQCTAVWLGQTGEGVPCTGLHRPPSGIDVRFVREGAPDGEAQHGVSAKFRVHESEAGLGIEAYQEGVVGSVAVTKPEAHKSKRRRDGEVKPRISPHVGGETLGESAVAPYACPEAFRTQHPQSEPELQGAKAAAKRHLERAGSGRIL